jgi:hypothetical protein
MAAITDGPADGAVLHTRADVKREHLAAFDHWQRTKHMPEAIAAPTCTRAAHYHTVADGLPAAWHGSGNVAANYSMADVEAIFAFLTSRELAEAVSDGVLWFDRFNELDGADYTGNIYEVVSAVGETTVADDAPYFAERFEVSSDQLPEFDRWLAGHMAALGRADDVLRVRVMHAIREGSPLPYYYSPGNRAIFVELTEVRAVLGEQLTRAVTESRAWDLHLPYVRRDVYECAFVVS